jgi:ABC-type glycerol-3-phosphate transport system substrate-binding protein
MAIELYWDNDEQTVMLCEVRDPWTWDDLFDTLGKIKKVTDRSPVTIGAILDVSHGITIPGGSLFSPATFENAKKMIKMGEGGTGPIVVVGANPLIKAVYNAAGTIDRKALSNFAFVPTLDEARAHLERVMPTPA